MDIKAGPWAGSWVVQDRASKGCNKSRPGTSDPPSDRWDQQQGILGHRPTQKSGRAGLGVLRSMFKGENPLQLAPHGSSIQPWERRLAGDGGGERNSDSQAACGQGQGEAQKGDLKQSRKLRVLPILEAHICTRRWPVCGGAGAVIAAPGQRSLLGV